MLEIKKLKDSQFYRNQEFIETYRGHGAFRESEVEGYWEKGIYFDNKVYSDYDLCVVEFNNKILCVCNFEDLSEDFQQIVDLKKFKEVQVEKEKEYNKYLKLKQKFEK